MKQITLSKPKVESDFNKLALVIIFALCFQGITAQVPTLKFMLDSNECSVNYGSGLSAQIENLVQQLYTCEEVALDFDQDDQKLYQFVTFHQIQNQFESAPDEFKLQYQKSNLPEYFLYKEFTHKESSCGDYEILGMLGSTFNDCYYCLGTKQCTRKSEIVALNSDLNEAYVEVFQLLWNCNNPDNQIEVTGQYGEITEKQLLETNKNGFDKVCFMCKSQNCSICTNDLSSCIECDEGYHMQQGGVCITCPLDKCSQCDMKNESFTCQECEEGFYLLNGECVDKCPSNYKTTQTQCIQCQQGTFAQGDTCEQCSEFCQVCTGPSFLQCSQCYEGYNFDQKEGCIIQDFGLTLSFKPKTFIDPITNTEKECNFSCDECIDSSDLCTQCNPKLNYFIKVDDRFRCYNRCPLYFEPSQSTEDQQNKQIECVKSARYTSDLEEADKIRSEAKNRCPKQQYWDILRKQCQKCTNNCISCSNDSSCLECEPDYYWNDDHKACSPCHPSCKKCTGPLSNQCLLCARGEKLFSNADGVCEEAVSHFSPQQKIFSQNEIYGDLQVCKEFLNQKPSYSVEFSQKFSISDSQWETIQMMPIKTCTFQEFQNRYKYFQKNKQNCDDKEISQSSVGKNGELVAIYSMLLSQSRAQISSNEVNPQTLVDYAISKDFFSFSFIFNPTKTFDCSHLQCVSQLDSLLYGFSKSDNTKEIIIKTEKDIILTSEKQTPLNCFQNGQQVNQNTVEEIEQIVNSSQYTLNTASKQYFILYLCGKNQLGNFSQKPLLVQKYLGNGFFEVINVSNPLSSQVEVINLYGASTQQNSYLKNCNTQLSNSFTSYNVQKVRVIQVIEQDRGTDKSELMFQQYNSKVSSANTIPTKCSCPETKEYILGNENQGSQFITVITPQNKILTESINVQDISHILKKYNIDADIMKANRLSITKIEANLLFQEYIEETIESAKKCYGISNSTPLCMINILADLLFSSNFECQFSQEITSIIKKSDFRGLNNFIKKQNWCNLHQERCLKAQQTMKSCI
ncbi:hypothetical protein TTHERM_00961840 (macronuclear) [Tetrahymena thermophila SB210]|uniref:EGF-like domain-containing protein n=1 Tax=Tetrahymena thermophila (strain SB210) TaxID=312017 RepID=Q23U03_TETTS|nr:hypothetical protein TTHERM_00961840 [Tetrahymena thermophila SB210]EAR99978.2 hypothetical protein TTHERM_00961840 [Tetrahymena thermophila SB210]|eukprot:XP_001020223.2 hypothetical protein TTHERM_00961840 [Tetrahymena thermophila SB210]